MSLPPKTLAGVYVSPVPDGLVPTPVPRAVIGSGDGRMVGVDGIFQLTLFAQRTWLGSARRTCVTSWVVLRHPVYGHLGCFLQSTAVTAVVTAID